MFTIFLVEDEEHLNEILTMYLQKEGWHVQSYYDGESALTAIPQSPHLWILDIMLPDIDGYHVLRKIKENSPKMPVIFISARDEVLDRIMGLELGSDDYLPKPFSPRELVIRVRRILERVYPTIDFQQYNLYPYVISESKRIVQKDHETLDLTSKEFELVLLFASHQGQALSREQIISHIWGENYVGTDRAVDDLVRRLRKKLPDLRIETLYGYGYRMVTP